MNVQQLSLAQQIFQEAYYQQIFSANENIVKIYALFVNQRQVPDIEKVISSDKMNHLPMGEYSILMERCQRSLIDILTQLEPKQFLSEPVIVNYFAQILSAFSTIHNYHIINRDTKIENMLLQNNQVKICDFGSCTQNLYNDPSQFIKNQIIRSKLETDIQNNTTPQYRAPEMIDLFCRQPINEKADVFALGCVLFRLMYKVLPFGDELLANFNCRYKFPDETDEFKRRSAYEEKDDVPIYSENLKNVVRKCLVKEVNQRADVFQLIEMLKAMGQRFPRSCEEKGQLHDQLANSVNGQQNNNSQQTNQPQNQTNSLAGMLNWSTTQPTQSNQQSTTTNTNWQEWSEQHQTVQQQHTQQHQQNVQSQQNQLMNQLFESQQPSQPQQVLQKQPSESQQSLMDDLFSTQQPVQIPIQDFLVQFQKDINQRFEQKKPEQQIIDFKEIIVNQSNQITLRLAALCYLIQVQSYQQKQFQLKDIQQIYDQLNKQVLEAKQFNNQQQLMELRFIVCLYRIAECYSKINCDLNYITQNEADVINQILKLFGGYEILYQKSNLTYQRNFLTQNYTRLYNNIKLLISEECIIDDSIKQSIKENIEQVKKQVSSICGITF